MSANSASPIWRLVLPGAGPIVPLNESGDGAPFYCVHSVGGDVTSFLDLAQALEPYCQFYGIQVPREKLTASFAASIELMAQYYVEALMSFQPEGPFFLGGWSAGAVIALEIANKLRYSGRDVQLLVAIDGGPGNTHENILRRVLIYLWRFICNLPRWIKNDLIAGHDFQKLAKLVWRKTRRAAMRFVPLSDNLAHGHAIDGFMDTTGWSNGEIIFTRAFFDTARVYTAGKYQGHVVLYVARTQPLLHLQQSEASWKKIAESVEIIYVEGTHWSILRSPRVVALAKHLGGRLGPPATRAT